MITATITRTWHHGHERAVETFTANTLAGALDIARDDLPDHLFEDAFKALATVGVYRDWSWYTFTLEDNSPIEQVTA